MKWGIVFASTCFPEPDRAVAMAQAAEEAGFESLWAPEHNVVATGEGATPYRGSLDGKMDRLWRRGGIPDPLIWLAFVAGCTRSINLGTNVVIVPEHQPVVLAKSAATLDVLAGGRLLLGIGVGELPDEFSAVGMDFTNRGRRMDESIEAMRVLWSDEIASYAGRYVAFDQVRCEPRPVKGAIPLHVGGISDAAIRRTARFGDGYFPYVDPRQDLDEVLAHVIPAVREEARRVGRDPGTIEITVGGGRTVAEAERFARLGVDRLVIAVRAKEMDAVRDELAMFGKDVIAQTREL